MTIAKYPISIWPAFLQTYKVNEQDIAPAIIERTDQYVAVNIDHASWPVIDIPKSAIPVDQWPTWAKLIGELQVKSDTGVGDTVHRMLGVLGEIFKATLKKMGVPCGCDRRRDDWNKIYKYTNQN